MYHLIVFLPLIGFLIAGLLGRIIGARASEVVTTSLLGISGLLSWLAFFQVGFGKGATHAHVASWFISGDLVVDWAFQIDTLTAVMLVVVNTVSFLVHLYSIGYMAEDPSQPRFFAYLSLFTFAMLMLVTADNLVQMFFGWEGVGLASYLLIGFWYDRPSANAAAIKAFIVNRVGDFGFALGIFLVYTLFNSVTYAAIFPRAPELATATYHFLGRDWNALTLACLLLFMGAMGKSAQFLLHTWLPDAMEGPTPVSALIHAATMVTAGVFMVARLSPLFELAPAALSVVTVIGGITAFFAATIGLVQNDIKRVVAYSTCSQLGYMFVGLGVGAYSAGIFHLFTHAFFKALLFLSAGSVITAMHHEQDMRHMGGLRKYIPVTAAMMTIGNLALTGFPFTAGYFSKDAIIEASYASHTPGAAFGFIATVVAALLTSFYSWRLYFMTFESPERWHRAGHHGHGHDAHAPAAQVPVAQVPAAQVPVAQVPVAQVPVAQVPVAQVPVAHAAVAHAAVGGHADPAAGAHRQDSHAKDSHAKDAHGHDAHGHDAHANDAHGAGGHGEHTPHESPLVMLIPLGVLAFGALFSGFAFKEAFIGHNYESFWKGALGMGPDNHILHELHEVPGWVSLAPTIMMVTGFLIAFYFYILDRRKPAQLAATFSHLYKFLLNKWYFDELYDFLLVRPAMRLGTFLWKKGDGAVIDGFGPDGVSARVIDVTNRVVRIQTGFVYHYAFAMLIGVAALVTWYLVTGAH